MRQPVAFTNCTARRLRTTTSGRRPCNYHQEASTEHLVESIDDEATAWEGQGHPWHQVVAGMKTLFDRPGLCLFYLGRSETNRAAMHLSTATVWFLMLLFAIWGIPRAGCSTLDRRLEAYDCSSPIALEDRAMGDQNEVCTGQANVVKTAQNVSFQVLFKEKYHRLKGYRCELLDTRTVMYCGKYSHQTAHHKYDYTSLPKPMSAEKCRRIVEHNTFKMPNGRTKEVQVGEEYRAHWTEVGETYTGSDIIYPDKQVQCKGEDWKEDGELFKNMVVDHKFRITVTEEEFTWDGTEMVALSDKTRIPCGLFEQDCQTAEATYTWENPVGHCPLAVSKRATGLVTEEERGQKVFMSTDGSLIRLIMKHQVGYCERRVWQTNYPDIYLASEGSSMPFTRAIDPQEISIPTYTNNRDDFLYNHLIKQINEELGNVLKHDCEQRREAQRKDFYLAHKHPGIETYAFGNGTFATAAGEVLYYHRCRKETVTAVELSECYDALPVALPPESPLPSKFNDTQWFLEPLTHRLTRYASVVPCTKHFAPKYELDNGKWIQADPVLHMAENPKPMAQADFVLQHITPDADFSKGGGLYDEEDMKAWEAFTMIGRIRDAVVSSLGKEVTDNYKRGTSDEHFQTPSEWFKDKLKGLWGILQGYGNLSAAAITIVFIWRCLSTCFGYLYSGRQIYRDLGKFSPAMLWALCPTWHLLRDKAEKKPPPPPPAKDMEMKALVQRQPSNLAPQQETASLDPDPQDPVDPEVNPTDLALEFAEWKRQRDRVASAPRRPTSVSSSPAVMRSQSLSRSYSQHNLGAISRMPPAAAGQDPGTYGIPPHYQDFIRKASDETEALLELQRRQSIAGQPRPPVSSIYPNATASPASTQTKDEDQDEEEE